MGYLYIFCYLTHARNITFETLILNFTNHRKYPTKANIEEQKNAELKKIQRGEIIKQEQKFVRPTRANKANAYTEKKRKNRKRRIPRHENVTPVTDIYRGLISFPGTCQFSYDYIEYIF